MKTDWRKPCSQQVVRGEYAQHPRHCTCGRGFDRLKSGTCMHRSKHDCMHHARQAQGADKPSLSLQKMFVFNTQRRLAGAWNRGKGLCAH